jgi:hypothetical protein
MELTQISGKLLTAGRGYSGDLNKARHNYVVKISRRPLAYPVLTRRFSGAIFHPSHTTKFCFIFKMVPATGFEPVTP